MRGPQQGAALVGGSATALKITGVLTAGALLTKSIVGELPPDGDEPTG